MAKVGLILVCILFSTFCMHTAVVHSQGGAEPQELAEARKNYEGEQAKAIKTVNDRYQPKVEELKRQLTLKGNLKSALAAEEAAQKLSAGQLMVGSESDPQELKDIKRSYQQEIDAAVNPLRSLYLAKLEVLKQQLALGGNLKGALAVEEEASKYTQSVMKEDPIIGTWAYFTDDRIQTFLPQGRIAGDSTSNWKLLDKDKNLYRISWWGRFIDTVAISPDGKTLAGTNQAGTIVTGKKLH